MCTVAPALFKAEMKFDALLRKLGAKSSVLLLPGNLETHCAPLNSRETLATAGAVSVLGVSVA